MLAKYPYGYIMFMNKICNNVNDYNFVLHFGGIKDGTYYI